MLCLWLPEWPIQRLVAAEPEYRQQHLVLFRVDARKGKRVAAASPLARRAGVRTDMPLNEANSLLRRAAAQPIRNPASPALHKREKHHQDENRFFIFEHDPDVDLTALRTVG